MNSNFFKNICKVFCFTLIIVFLITNYSLANPPASTPFIDVPLNHKYLNSISFLKDNKVIIGYGDGSFRPESNLTRAEFMKIILLGTYRDIPQATKKPFKDVEMDKWYVNYIAFGAQLGYIEGYQDGTFRPDQNISKVEALKILGELVTWNYNSVDLQKTNNPFTDTDINEWYGKYLGYAINKNLLDDSGNSFGPNTPITRGQITEYIFRDYVVRNMNIDKYSLKDGETILGSINTINEGLSCKSANEALNTVKKYVVASEPNKDYLQVFEKNKALQKDDKFEYFIDGKNEAQSQKIAQESWFFWLDLEPGTKFEHDAKIVTVNSSNCQIAEYKTNLWPIVKDQVLWSTDKERDASKELVYWGEKADAPGAIAALPDPVFSPCNADETKRKKAIVLYIGADHFIKMDAVNMQKHLCSKNYQTTVITGDNNVTIYNDIITNLQTIAAASKAEHGALNSFVFYVSSHGRRATGDLEVKIDTERNADGTEHRVLKFIELPYVTSAIGSEGFSEIASETFTVEHDTCFSGNAAPLYKAEAEAAHVVGWVGTSSDAASVSRAFTTGDKGGVHTTAIIRCDASFSPYANFQECIKGEMKQMLEAIPDTSTIEHLTAATDNSIPFLP